MAERITDKANKKIETTSKLYTLTLEQEKLIYKRFNSHIKAPKSNGPLAAIRRYLSSCSNICRIFWKYRGHDPDSVILIMFPVFFRDRLIRYKNLRNS